MVQTHLVLVALAQYTHFAMSHACIILLHIVWWWLCIGALCGRSCPRGVPWLPQRRTIPVHRPTRQATNHLIISIQSHVLAPALFYCIKTTQFKLLCAAVVEPISSAWPVIATVTRWNPLACVGVDWAICMCCSYLAMPAMLRVVSGLVHLGDGLEWNDYVGNESGVVNTIW